MLFGRLILAAVGRSLLLARPIRGQYYIRNKRTEGHATVSQSLLKACRCVPILVKLGVQDFCGMKRLRE